MSDEDIANTDDPAETSKPVENSQRAHTHLSDHKAFSRFFTESFLLNRGLLTFKAILKKSTYYALTTAAQLFIFGGGLGLIWVLSHLEPQGDLAQYLLPITILAMPVAVIAQNTHWVDKLLNTLFGLSFISCFAWSCWWYFEYPDWGYQAKWIAIEGVAVSLLLYLTYRKPLAKSKGPQQALIYRFWLIGVLVSLGALSFLGYYISSQTAPEPGTSNILSGSSFVLFLAILIIRVYWLDGFRARRANRAEYTDPPDHIILFEWIIPRSLNFTITLCMLMIAQSMMFSTIYRASQSKQEVLNEQGDGKNLPLSSAQVSLESPAHMETPLLSLPHQKSSLRDSRRPNVTLSSWVFFSFKPYVFPKDHLDREVIAPVWFKYLGRALLGLMIAILLTKQLNIWKQIMACYWMLLGATRAEKHRGVTNTLTRQQEEMVDHLSSIFNHYSFTWRWLLMYAVTAPTMSLRWRLIFDPASAYYMGMERVHDWVTSHWDAAISIVAALIVLITLPFCYQHPENFYPFITACAPAATSALFIFILRVLGGLKPPNSYQWWIWWLLISHLILSSLNFFLAINVGTEQAFWSQILWYAQLGTIVGYPALYLLGGERYKRVHNPNRRLSVSHEDCDVEVRKRLLTAFADTEHRLWFFGHLTQRVHPVRSSRLQLRLITPSLVLSTLEGLRNTMSTTREVLTPLIGNYTRALRIWPLVIMAGWVCTITHHLFQNHRFLPLQIIFAYGLDLLIIASPSIALILFDWAIRSREAQERSLSLFAKRLFGLVLFSTCAIVAWNTLPQLHLGLSQSLIEARAYNSWLIGLSCPLLSLWHLLWSRKKRRGVKEEMVNDHHQTESNDLDRLSPLQRMEHFLQELEEQLISSVYQKTHRGRSFEFRYQSTMILNLSRVVESSYQRLRSGQLFKEERHALSRVRGDLLSNTENRDVNQLGVIEEICTLLESAFDTLGSLLHDLTLTDLLFYDEDQQVSASSPEEIPSPHLEIVLEALCKIASYPLPQKSENNPSPSSSDIERLYICHAEVIALTEYLVTQAFSPCASSASSTSSTLAASHISDEDALTLLRLWCLLESQRCDDRPLHGDLSPAFSFIYERLKDEDHTLSAEAISELLNITHLHPHGLVFIEKISDLKLIEQLPHQLLPEIRALHILPTPISRLLQALHHASRRFELAEQLWRDSHNERQDARGETGTQEQVSSLSDELSDPQVESTSFLKTIQSPHLVSLIEREMNAYADLDRANRQRYEDLSALYFGSFAYLICLLKDLDQHRVIQQLSWQSANAVEESLSALETHQGELIEDSATSLVDVITSHFQAPHAHFMEQGCRDRSSWKTLLKTSERLIAKLTEASIDHKIPYLEWEVSSSKEGDEPSYLVFSGPSPRFKATPLMTPFPLLTPSTQEDSINLETRSPSSRLGRGVRLRGENFAPQVDYYTSLWLLNQLYHLVHSDGIFQSNTTSGLGDHISQLYTLLIRLGKLMKTFAGEEQGVIERIFDLTFRRLKALKAIGRDSIEVLEGKGTIHFQETMNRVEAYLQGIEARRQNELCMQAQLSIPPLFDFSYLLNVETHEGEELRTYVSLEGHAEVLFKNE